MMMMMMTMENVVDDDDDDDDDDDVMTTTAKQSSSKISKKKKKRTPLLFLAIYQSVVSLRRDVFLRLSVSLSVCKSAFILRASPWSGERFFGGRNFFWQPLFLLLLIGQKKRSHVPTLLCLSLSRVEHIPHTSFA
jgi:hypothetical protein